MLLVTARRDNKATTMLHLIDQIPVGSPGVLGLLQPERGPRLVLVHRPEGVMAYTHSHHCWVTLAPSAAWRRISAGTRSAMTTAWRS